jgi:hypothetical protein
MALNAEQSLEEVSAVGSSSACSALFSFTAEIPIYRS